MTEPTKHTFSLHDLAVAMVKAKGLHEGEWLLGFDFGLGAANIGPTPNEAFPAAIAHILNATLVEADATAPASLRVNAAQVNPKRTSRGAKAKSAD